jgi:hypothetical protein
MGCQNRSPTVYFAVPAMALHLRHDISRKTRQMVMADPSARIAGEEATSRASQSHR